MTAPQRASRRRRRGIPRDPVVVLTEGLEDEPAVRAWRELGAGPRPTRIELLRKRRKSVVYRLPGVGAGGSDVIAKQGLWEGALDERAAYERLSALPLDSLAYYGFVADPARDHGWLFVEDAGGEPWNPDDDAHRRLSTRWLAALHTASSRTSGAGLADRGLAWFRSHLDAAPARIRAAFDNPALPPDARPVLDRMLRMLDDVDARWDEIERLCAPLPRALVHGDFAERNVRVRAVGSETRLLAFDWEVSGWGLPVADLVDVDVDAYAEAVRADWPGLDGAALAHCAQLGELLRGGVVATSWAAESLGTSWPHDAVREMPHYQRRITHALATLGLDGPSETS